MSPNIRKPINRAEERSPQIQEAESILNEVYEMPLTNKEGTVIATTFREKRAVAFVPVAPHGGDYRVQISRSGLAVDGSEISSFLADQLHSATIEGHLYYVIDLEAGQQPDFLELAFLEFEHDVDAKAPSLKVYANKATILRATGVSGKPIKGYTGSGDIPLRVVATRRENFARIKVNPQLEGIYTELNEN